VVHFRCSDLHSVTRWDRTFEAYCDVSNIFRDVQHTVVSLRTEGQIPEGGEAVRGERSWGLWNTKFHNVIITVLINYHPIMKHTFDQSYI
jgi:hypothetical protein